MSGACAETFGEDVEKRHAAEHEQCIIGAAGALSQVEDHAESAVVDRQQKEGRHHRPQGGKGPAFAAAPPGSRNEDGQQFPVGAQCPEKFRREPEFSG